MITPEMLSQINDPDALKALVLEWAKTAQEKEQLAQQIAQDAALKIQSLTQLKQAVEVENNSNLILDSLIFFSFKASETAFIISSGPHK